MHCRLYRKTLLTCSLYPCFVVVHSFRPGAKCVKFTLTCVYQHSEDGVVFSSVFLWVWWCVSVSALTLGLLEILSIMKFLWEQNIVRRSDVYSIFSALQALQEHLCLPVHRCVCGQCFKVTDIQMPYVLLWYCFSLVTTIVSYNMDLFWLTVDVSCCGLTLLKRTNILISICLLIWFRRLNIYMLQGGQK